MCPLAVAGLGSGYLSINVLDKFGHPSKKPFLVALRSLDILGLHKEWWANLTLFAHVEMEWATFAVCYTILGFTGFAICKDGLWVA